MTAYLGLPEEAFDFGPLSKVEDYIKIYDPSRQKTL